MTSHNSPVVRQVGIPQAEQPGLARLLASGAAHWCGGKPALLPAVPVVGDGKTVSEVVAEDRA